MDNNNNFYENNTFKVPETNKSSGRKNTFKIVALALGCSLLGGTVGAGGMALTENVIPSIRQTVKDDNNVTVYEGVKENPAMNVSYKDTFKEMSASEIYAENVNSTVGITTSITTNYFGYQTTTPASGSGFILTEDGYIITNYHVIEDASEIKVTTYGGDVYDAKLIGYDESNDIAVIKVDAENLTPVVLGDSDELSVGDDVIAIGNPLGELTFSLTSGAVSALNRNVTISSTSMNLIQTDCAINSGNSGGALFNSYGEVIGITNAKYSNNGDYTAASIDNIGFAIPINNVKDIITEIIEDGSITKPYIGVYIYDLGSDYQRFGLSGAVVQKVDENSPAEAAGLKQNDLITKVNGEEISDSEELRSIIAKGSEGDIVTLTVNRNGEILEIEVTLSFKKQSALPKENNTPQNEQQMQNPFMNGGFPDGNFSNEFMPNNRN
ncbi:MAG: trypsin-like peptidase domain-containing protein [Lachnospiraceae bacterium]|nr:trypsin-like peptidase domain-containing protein [Lachnospiraceae bacterium]